MKCKLIHSVLFYILSVHLIWAQVPPTISYQGVLTDAAGEVVSDGDYPLTFRLYETPTGDPPIWTESQTVSVSNGLFNVILGAVTPLELPFITQYWLGVSIGETPELTPRIQLTSSPYSFNARSIIGGSNVFPSEGNVGIGEPNPVEKLEVFGTIHSKLEGFKFPDGTVQTTAATGSGIGVWTRDAANNEVELTNIGDKVGIGTASPSAKLHVNDNLQIGDDAKRISMFTHGLGEDITSTNTLHLNYGNNQAVSIGEGGTGDLYVSGKVGIGTTIPDYKLDVQGGSGLAINAQSSGSNAISAASSAGGGFAAVKADANAANTYGVWGSSDSYVGGRFESTSGTALEATTSSGYAATFMGGDVGIGTTSPQSNLHIAGSSSAYLRFDHGGPTQDWAVGSNNIDNESFQILSADDYGSATRFRIQTDGETHLAPLGGNVGIGTMSPNHPLEMASGAHVTSAGVWTNASSREYKENIRDLSYDEAKFALSLLKPTKFNYKVDKDDDYLGFIAEDVPDLVATKDRKGLSSMDIVAVLTKVVQMQQKEIEELKARLNERQ
jgi:hypothetical protein